MAASSAPVDQFCVQSERIGVPVTRVPIANATETLVSLCEPPAIAASLPWSNVRLPTDAVTDPTPTQLDEATTGITAAIGAVAEYGSLLLRSTMDGVEPVSLFPDHHVAVVHEDDIVPDMATAFDDLGKSLREEGASVIIATGPSATADMGELVTGAHGPKSVHVLLLEGGKWG